MSSTRGVAAEGVHQATIIYGKAGTNKAELCAEHAKDGMVNVRVKRCGHGGCHTRPSYGKAGTNKAELCAEHAIGMEWLTSAARGVATAGATKNHRTAKAGTSETELCAEHARSGIVNVVHRSCAHSGCTKHPSYGKAGTSATEFCAKHARSDMVDVVRKPGTPSIHHTAINV